MLRLVGFVSAAIFAVVSADVYEGVLIAQAVGGAEFATMLGVALLVLLIGGLSVCAATAGESLAFERSPHVVAGIGELAHLRLVMPEIVPAVAFGYLFGTLLCLNDALLAFFASRFDLGSPSSASTAFVGTPLVNSLLNPASAVGVALALLFVTALLLRIPHSPRVVYTIPAIATGVGFVVAGYGIASALSAVVATAMLTFVLWRFGVLATVLAVMVSESIDDTVSLLLVGDLRHTLGVASLLTSLAIPLFVAVLAKKRFAPGHHVVSGFSDSQEAP
jgi:hypothetical protein